MADKIDIEIHRYTQRYADIDECQYRAYAVCMSSVESPIACCQKLADDDFDEKARLVVLKALADPVRLRIVTSLAQSEQDSMCACSMPDTYGVSQPTLSHHLKKLVEAGVLRREQRGNWAHFSICPDTLVLLRDFIGGLIQS